MMTEKTDVQHRISNRLNRAVTGGNKNLDRPGRKKRTPNNVLKNRNIGSRSNPIRRGGINNPGNRNYSSRRPNSKKNLDIHEKYRKVYRFLLDNKDNEQALRSISNKEGLLELVESLIAVNMGGWRDEGQFYINESGRIVDKDRWDLLEGRLAIKGGQPLNGDVEWLHQIRKTLKNSKN